MTDYSDFDQHTMLTFTRSRLLGLFHIFWITSLVLGVIGNVTLLTFLQRFDTSLGFDLRDMEILANTTIFSVVAFNLAWIVGFALMFWLVLRTIKRLPALPTETSLGDAEREVKALRNEKFDLQAELADEQQQTHQLIATIAPTANQLRRASSDHALWQTMAEQAQNLAHADSATIYLKTPTNQLKPVVTRHGSYTQTLDTLPILELSNAQKAEQQNIITATFQRNSALNVADLDDNASYDFTSIKQLDALHDQQTQALLTVPLHSHDQTIIGVLLLTNAQASPFSRMSQQKIEILAQLAAAFTNNKH